MTEDGSLPLIKYLNAHAAKPEFVCRHRWRKHGILVSFFPMTGNIVTI